MNCTLETGQETRHIQHENEAVWLVLSRKNQSMYQEQARP